MKISDLDKFTPIKICAYWFIASGIGWIVITLFNIGEGTDSFLFYSAAISAFYHIIIGIGIILRKMWGYYLFKSYLYIFLICFPLGTYISIKALKYLNKDDIKNYFVRHASN